MAPGFWQREPLQIDGVILDGPFSTRFESALKSKAVELVDRATLVMMDHQTYRLIDGARQVDGLSRLPYCRQNLLEIDDNAGYTPEDFADVRVVSKFVKSVLEFQRSIGVSDYISPAFFVNRPDSPWTAVNTRLLEESIAQVGTFVYAMLPGSTESLRDAGLVDSLSKSGAAGVYALISPVAAQSDSINKLVRYTEALRELKDRGLDVIAARQPAFGLLLLAAGLASFDSGIAQAESFDFPSKIRVPKPNGKEKSGRGGKARRVYSTTLMRSLPQQVAKEIFDTPGLRSLFVCRGPCCKDSLSNAISSPREHFVWSRTSEIEDIRNLQPAARLRHIENRLETARQASRKLQRHVGDLGGNSDYVERWTSVLEVTAGVMRGGR